MGTFNTKKTIKAAPSLIQGMAERIEQEFLADGFEVTSTRLLNGGCDISITKGNMFKAVLGMKTALKVSLTPQDGNVYFDAGVGIYGQQAIPTIISMFIFWPVLLTQIWGMIEQSELDDKALEIAEKYVAEHDGDSPDPAADSPAKRFCTNCGHELEPGSTVCPNCKEQMP